MKGIKTAQHVILLTDETPLKKGLRKNSLSCLVLRKIPQVRIAKLG